MRAVRVVSVVYSVALYTIRRLLLISPYLLQNVVYIWRTFGHELCYGAASDNSTKMQRLYSDKYPNRNVSSAKIFCKIDQRSRDTGTSKPAESGGRIQHDDSDLRDRILHRI